MNPLNRSDLHTFIQDRLRDEGRWLREIIPDLDKARLNLLIESDEYDRILHLIYTEQVTDEELADMLDCTLSEARLRKEKAIKALHHSLESQTGWRLDEAAFAFALEIAGKKWRAEMIAFIEEPGPIPDPVDLAPAVIEEAAPVMSPISVPSAFELLKEALQHQAARLQDQVGLLILSLQLVRGLVHQSYRFRSAIPIRVQGSIADKPDKPHHPVLFSEEVVTVGQVEARMGVDSLERLFLQFQGEEKKLADSSVPFVFQSDKVLIQDTVTLELDYAPKPIAFYILGYFDEENNTLSTPSGELYPLLGEIKIAFTVESPA